MCSRQLKQAKFYRVFFLQALQELKCCIISNVKSFSFFFLKLILLLKSVIAKV